MNKAKYAPLSNIENLRQNALQGMPHSLAGSFLSSMDADMKKLSEITGVALSTPEPKREEKDGQNNYYEIGKGKVVIIEQMQRVVASLMENSEPCVGDLLRGIQGEVGEMLRLSKERDVQQAEKLETIVVGREEIEKILPLQKGEFAFPQEVLVIPEKSRAIGETTIKSDWSFIENHGGIMPGVINIEYAQQVALVLLEKLYPGASGTAGEMIAGENTEMFFPGDEIMAEVLITRNDVNASKKRGKASVVAQVYKKGSKNKITIKFTPLVMPAKTLIKTIGIHKKKAEKNREDN